MMVYITRQKNSYIKISENARDCENAEILYYLDDVNIHNIYKDLREFVILNLGDGWYKNSQYVLDYFIGNFNPRPLIYVYDVDINNLLLKFNENFDILKKLGYIDVKRSELKNREKIIYKCDIINALEDTYDKKLVSLVFEFSQLSDKTKLFLSNLCRQGLEYFKKTFPEILAKDNDVIKFLPEYYKIYYKTFKLSDPKLETKILPEFKNNEVLGEIKKKEDLGEIIYSRFELGKVYSGSLIKSILQEIYSEFEIKKTAKIVDIFDYFEVVKVNLKKESSYRIERRKIL